MSRQKQSGEVGAAIRLEFLTEPRTKARYALAGSRQEERRGMSQCGAALTGLCINSAQFEAEGHAVDGQLFVGRLKPGILLIDRLSESLRRPMHIRRPQKNERAMNFFTARPSF